MHSVFMFRSYPCPQSVGTVGAIIAILTTKSSEKTTNISTEKRNVDRKRGLVRSTVNPYLGRHAVLPQWKGDLLAGRGPLDPEKHCLCVGPESGCPDADVRKRGDMKKGCNLSDKVATP